MKDCFCIYLPFISILLSADSVTHTVELNALCMKLGKKPIYKPIDAYQGMRPAFNYNIRAPGPYARSMHQYEHSLSLFPCAFEQIRFHDTQIKLNDWTMLCFLTFVMWSVLLKLLLPISPGGASTVSYGAVCRRTAVPRQGPHETGSQTRRCC